MLKIAWILDLAWVSIPLLYSKIVIVVYEWPYIFRGAVCHFQSLRVVKRLSLIWPRLLERLTGHIQLLSYGSGQWAKEERQQTAALWWAWSHAVSVFLSLSGGVKVSERNRVLMEQKNSVKWMKLTFWPRTISVPVIKLQLWSTSKRLIKNWHYWELTFLIPLRWLNETQHRCSCLKLKSNDLWFVK